MLKIKRQVQKEPFIMSLEGPVLIYQIQSVYINSLKIFKFNFLLYLYPKIFQKFEFLLSLSFLF